MLVVAQAVWADYASSFRAGMAALERKNWSEVAQQMQAAIEDRGKEGGTVKLYGMHFETYLPHYYLGLARYNLGDFAGAVAAWEVSEKQGAISGTLLKDLRAKKAECQARLPKTVERAPDPVRQEPVVKEPEAAVAVSPKAPDPVVVDQTVKPKPAPEPPPPIPPPPIVPPSVPPPRQTEPSTVLTPPRPTEPAARREEERPIAPQKSAPPAGLRSAAEAFFKADYQATLTLLERVAGEPRARATALLLSAAARYALYLEGGSKDEALRRAAAADAASCHELDGAVRPDPAFFSPVFVRFFAGEAQKR